MIALDYSNIQLKLKQEDGKTSVWDAVRRKWVILTPEEHVRQYMLSYMVGTLHYPASLIAVERAVLVGTLNKRFDIVVYNRNHKPWMLIECKAPEVSITEKTLHQLLSYQQTIQCPYWLLTNGHQTFCADATEVGNIKWVGLLPAYEL